ncbi:DUF2332 domain-containing protein [Phycicoccus sp. BSK3Z-2]|uniref:DUF2332 domain-containing protein n=1 Tax=Phycicoccus avicenniae TaxID=2828860 RepID=A0A941I0F1_9MICO|nr:DUF2332 domain-containing protein [Phycicoccus avicenniae]MBR7743855.1 DUF2332 domain-containing protein [Phycicoccus avicenniae]
MTATDSLPERLRAHFGHREHLYGVLFEEMADDWDDGGVTHQLFRGWEDAEARQFPQLRLMAGLFRIVLRGEAPQLVPFYPALGGEADPEEAWAAVRPVLAAHVDELHAALSKTPQTNEPARSVALLVGLSEAVRRTGLRRVRLLEPGASAGLGLLVDHYRFVGDGWSAGPEGSPLVLEDCGAAGFDPEPFQVLERRGCDIDPVDASTEVGSDYLRSFVWPWMIDRHLRLDDALSVAAREPVVIDRARASEWVREQLAQPVASDVLTVVWHSVTRMYWPLEESLAVTAAVEEARDRTAVAHVSMENPWEEGAAAPSVDREHLPVVELDGEVLGTCGHHGPPVELA